MISLGSRKVHDWIEDVKFETGNGNIVIDVDEIVSNKDIMVISRSRFLELDANDDFLNALRAAGVDNWDGYSLAQEIMEEG